MSKLSKVLAYLNKPIQEVAADVASAVKGAALALTVGTAAVAATVQSSPAMAQVDYDGITAVADWTDVAAGVITIFAALALVLVALKGGRKLLSAIGR